MNINVNPVLSGKVAAITGAGGVLCGMFAKALAKAGCKVAVLDHNMEHAQAVVDSIVAEGGIAKAFFCNVLDKEDQRTRKTCAIAPSDILVLRMYDARPSAHGAYLGFHPAVSRWTIR